MITESKGTRLQNVSNPNLTPVKSGMLQRACACGQHSGSNGGECEECRVKHQGMLQRSATNASPMSEIPPIVHEVLRLPGSPLDTRTRAFMEPRFGHDFSKVRVHTDVKAAESAQSVNARAYTLGRDVVFGNGRYNPNSGEGQKLIAHELTHVVQQQNNIATKPRSVSQTGDPFEKEADSIALRVFSGDSISVNSSVQGATILRQALTTPMVGPMSVPAAAPMTMGSGSPSLRGQSAVAIALGEVGVTEDRRGSNRGACPPGATRGCVDAYTGGKDEAWCAHFVSWCFEQTGLSPFGHRASVRGLRNWGRRQGWYVESSQAEIGAFVPMSGDIFTKHRYEGSGPNASLVGGHTGLVVSYDPSTQILETVEGNSGRRTNAVVRQTRELGQLDGFIRIGGVSQQSPNRASRRRPVTETESSRTEARPATSPSRAGGRPSPRPRPPETTPITGVTREESGLPGGPVRQNSGWQYMGGGSSGLCQRLAQEKINAYERHGLPDLAFVTELFRRTATREGGISAINTYDRQMLTWGVGFAYPRVNSSIWPVLDNSVKSYLISQAPTFFTTAGIVNNPPLLGAHRRDPLMISPLIYVAENEPYATHVFNAQLYGFMQGTAGVANLNYQDIVLPQGYVPQRTPGQNYYVEDPHWAYFFTRLAHAYGAWNNPRDLQLVLAHTGGRLSPKSLVMATCIHVLTNRIMSNPRNRRVDDNGRVLISLSGYVGRWIRRITQFDDQDNEWRGFSEGLADATLIVPSFANASRPYLSAVELSQIPPGHMVGFMNGQAYDLGDYTGSLEAASERERQRSRRPARRHRRAHGQDLSQES